MKVRRSRGRIAMRPYKFTVFHPFEFEPEKSSLKSFMLVGAHGNAPDDHTQNNVD
jgi:hypothetical protein